MQTENLTNLFNIDNQPNEVLVLCMENEIGEFEPVKVKGDFVFTTLAGANEYKFNVTKNPRFRFANAKNFFNVIHMEIK